jgi:HK97 family phage portal protein
MLSVVSSVLLNGNAFGVVKRDQSTRITSIHPQDARSVQVAVDDRTGMIFYDSAGSILSGQAAGRYGSNDVMHLRCFTEAGSLRGMSPLAAAAFSVDHTQQMQAQQTQFFKAHARPDGILTTDSRLSEPQVQRLQQTWKESFSGEKVGNTAVLEGNLKWQSLTLTAGDMALIESLNWGIDDICRVFRVPLWMVNRTEASTYNNVETLGRVFVMQTLGFWVTHLEQQLNILFNLPLGEYMKFSVEAGLMRSEFPTRIEALRTAVQGGIYSPNEARQFENLAPVEGGDEVFLQAQMEPVEQRAQEPEPIPEALDTDPEEDDPTDEEVANAQRRLEMAHENGVLRQRLVELEHDNSALQQRVVELDPEVQQ